MAIQISAITFANPQKTETIHFEKIPHICPFCQKAITPRTYQGFLNVKSLEIVFVCPNAECAKVFTGQYKRYDNAIFQYISSSIGSIQTRDFSENIIELTPSFVEIYNQALHAESLNLAHISGIGYRKALEFLIKDYLINKNPKKEESIKKKFLGNCIKEDIDNKNLKDIAERAAWLGNDEAHYVRKWEKKDVTDLKKLIDVSLHWIEMEILTEQYKAEM